MLASSNPVSEPWLMARDAYSAEASQRQAGDPTYPLPLPSL